MLEQEKSLAIYEKELLAVIMLWIHGSITSLVHHLSYILIIRVSSIL